MHQQDSAAAVLEHDELVLERLPNGEHAWLKPEHPERDDDNGVDASGRWNGQWLTYRIQAVTTYSLIASSLLTALEWFTDRADIERVDCDAMEFGDPILIAIEDADGAPAADPLADELDAVGDGPRFDVTDAGRRALAMAHLFGCAPEDGGLA